MENHITALIPSDEERVRKMESEVDVQRRRFAESVTLLRERVEDISDWKTWVAKMPWTALAGCAVLGWAAGRITSRR